MTLEVNKGLFVYNHPKMVFLDRVSFGLTNINFSIVPRGGCWFPGRSHKPTYGSPILPPATNLPKVHKISFENCLTAGTVFPTNNLPKVLKYFPKVIDISIFCGIILLVLGVLYLSKQK